MLYEITVHIEIEAPDAEAARQILYDELDSRPATGADNPFLNIDVADVVEVETDDGE